MLGIATLVGLLLLLAIGTWRRPAVGFAAVLCLYGLKQWGQDSSPFLSEHREIANFAVAILVAVGLWRMRGQQRPAHIKSLPRSWVLAIALYLYAFASLAWAPDPQGSLQQWALDAPYVAVIAFAAPLLLQNHEDVRHVCSWTVVVGGILCALALFFGHWGARGLLLAGDVLDQETNPLAIASLGGTVCVMAVLSIQQASWWRKLLYAVLGPIALATIVRSGSRGQLLAAGLALLLGWPLASSRRSFRAWLTLAVAVGVLSAVGFWIWQHVNLNVDSGRWDAQQSQEQVQGRLEIAGSLLQRTISNPGSLIFGLGNSSSFYYAGIYPHIAAAEVLAEEGLVGMALYLSIMVATGGSLSRLMTASVGRLDPVARNAYGLLAALFVFELTLTMKEGTLLSSTYVFAYAAIIGRMSQQPATEPDASSAQPQITALPFPNLMR